MDEANPPHGTLSTRGIEGAQVKQRHRPSNARAQQASLCKTFEDEAGMRPRVLHPALAKPHTQHNTSDIDGAQPRTKSPAARRPRGINPLSPVYQLPPAPASEPPEPRFLRDTLDVSDIPGARSRRAGHVQPGGPSVQPATGEPWQWRSGLVVTDIEGTCPGWRPLQGRLAHLVRGREAAVAGAAAAAASHRAALDASDINVADHWRRWLRQRHAQQQQQQQQQQEQQLLRSDGRCAAMEWSGEEASDLRPPGPAPRSRPSECDNSLRTCDIEGVRLLRMRDNDPFVTKFRRRHPKVTNSVVDVEGAQPAAHDPRRLRAQRLDAAAARQAAGAAAAQLLDGLGGERAKLEALWRACRELDRDGSGRVAADELTLALQRSGLGERLPAGALPVLVAGLKDNAGLLDYTPVTKRATRRAPTAPPAATLAPTGGMAPGAVAAGAHGGIGAGAYSGAAVAAEGTASGVPPQGGAAEASGAAGGTAACPTPNPSPAAPTSGTCWVAGAAVAPGPGRQEPQASTLDLESQAPGRAGCGQLATPTCGADEQRAAGWKPGAVPQGAQAALPGCTAQPSLATASPAAPHPVAGHPPGAPGSTPGGRSALPCAGQGAGEGRVGGSSGTAAGGARRGERWLPCLTGGGGAPGSVRAQGSRGVRWRGVGTAGGRGGAVAPMAVAMGAHGDGGAWEGLKDTQQAGGAHGASVLAAPSWQRAGAGGSVQVAAAPGSPAVVKPAVRSGGGREWEMLRSDVATVRALF